MDMTDNSDGIRWFDQLLKQAASDGASDIHLKANQAPVIRKSGSLQPLSRDFGLLKSRQIKFLLNALMTPQQIETFTMKKSIDMAYEIPHLGRFRVNAFQQLGRIRMVIRYIPQAIPRLDQLNLPTKVRELTQIERGLILITGTAGSGKSTTLAAMVNEINQNKSKHIVTIEDPVEFLIPDQRSLVSQVEVGSDTPSFSAALKSALRQDPDIILIGEMRDPETIRTALVAAETGHLVISTLHTLNASETIQRILAAFPADQNSQIRYQLASVLEAVVSLRLAKVKEGTGLIPATEVLINNPRVSDLINDPKRTSEIQNVIEESVDSWGMQSFDQSLLQLIKVGVIDLEEAIRLTNNPENFRLKYSGIFAEGDRKKWRKKGA